MLTVFDTPEYIQARENRLRNLFQHVNPFSLIGSRVLEVGCGTGELGEEFVKMGCQVTSIDARPEYTQELQRRFPQRFARTVNLEEGVWYTVPQHIVLAFGTLYHLQDPFRFLHLCSQVASVLYLETIVTDSDKCICPTVPEAGPSHGTDQSFTGLGCRPTPAWLTEHLHRTGYAVLDISSPVANWDTAIFDWTPQNDGQWIRHGKTLRKMYICTQELRVQSE